MLRKILSLVKKIIVAVLLIYAYNKISFHLGLFIPFNVFTLLLVIFCGMPAIIMLVLFSLICI